MSLSIHTVLASTHRQPPRASYRLRLELYPWHHKRFVFTCSHLVSPFRSSSLTAFTFAVSSPTSILKRQSTQPLLRIHSEKRFGTRPAGSSDISRFHGASEWLRLSSRERSGGTQPSCSAACRHASHNETATRTSCCGRASCEITGWLSSQNVERSTFPIES